MPRTVKCRRVCAEPRYRLFLPEEPQSGVVTLSVVELEALRLCDLEGLDQDAAAKIMNVSRGTLQRILYAARKSTAAALVGGQGIRIEGGNYEVASCPCGCERACRHCKFTNEA